jgi:predicted RNase H-like nuclease/ppGpp synthetase/RelA/SpoT-type nucleotidyltranferase
MHFVGVDLAWAARQPTGLAVLDDDGCLVHISTARTDDEIVEALGPYVERECLVAIDAPLVVPNATGNRPAEAALNKDFARFDAGAHPANTGKPELVRPRGAALSSRLGLDMNPRSGRGRRAIEVYPHPATVALFRLGRTLKYKNKPGRSFDRLRGELLVLMGLVEGLAAAPTPMLLDHPAWRALVSHVETATRKSQLRVVEDQVDAVICAYVALFAAREPDQVTTYGDYEAGYIVTPTLPAGQTPTPRERRTPRDPVRAAVEEYATRQPALVEAGQQYVALITSILDEAGINYLTVGGRTKSVASFATKASRSVDGVPVYTDPLREITDQIGVRVITYVHSDVSAVADLLGTQLRVIDDRDLGQETASEGRFGYASRHLLVSFDNGQPAFESLRGLTAQVQVRTVLQHAWAEFEHDIRYKGTVPEEHARDFDRRFTLAAGLLELADQEFTTIRDRLRGGSVADTVTDTDGVSPRELAAYLAGQYADAEWSRADHYAWIAGLLPDLGITTLAELGDVLAGVDGVGLTARMDYRYPPGAVRRLDDALLAAFGERYVELPGNEHRRPLLRARLEKMTG